MSRTFNTDPMPIQLYRRSGVPIPEDYHWLWHPPRWSHPDRSGWREAHQNEWRKIDRRLTRPYPGRYGGARKGINEYGRIENRRYRRHVNRQLVRGRYDDINPNRKNARWLAW